jgi:hypothetical protein
VSKKELNRADFMTPFQKEMMGRHPRTHQNCKAHTGVSRPGKTAKDRALRAR